MENMENINYIEIKRYGDFDILQTDSIWYGTNPRPSAGAHWNTTNTDDFKNALIKAGYKRLKTIKVEFGGNL